MPIFSSGPDLITKLVSMDVGADLKPESFSQTTAIAAYQWELVGAFYLGRIIPSAGNSFTRFVAAALGTPETSTPKWRMNYLYANYWRGYLKGKSFGADLPDNLSFLYLYGEKKPFMLHTKDWLEKIKASACCDIKGLAGSGHWLMRDQTEQVGDLILAWVE